ncbi:Vacuole effluxer Atg22 like protein [compost metagenome]
MNGLPKRVTREIWAWAMYDFANSGYSTVVLTAVYNAYFVGVVAGQLGTGRATLLWTLALGLSNSLVILSAPLIGAIADARGTKKRFLALSTFICAVSTAILGVTGNLPLAVTLLILSNLAFATGENLVAAFLPEVAPEGKMGRVSAFGWSLGYLGGLSVLGLSLALVGTHAQQGSSHGVPLALGLAALIYGIAALPTFIWVPERRALAAAPPRGYLKTGFGRLKRTADEIETFPDLRWFLAAGFAMASGTFTVTVLAAVYAHEVFGFATSELLGLFMVLNVVAAGGTIGFGQLQDRWGSVPALNLSLGLWIASLGLAFMAQNRPTFWAAAIGVGVAMGGSQSMGRALLGMLTPPERFAEFYGFWGMTVRLAAVVGPLSFGAIVAGTGGNLRLGLLSTATYFLLGMLLLTRVDERRGRARAHHAPGSHASKENQS